MTQEEWDKSADAKEMLRALYALKPLYFHLHTKALHCFLIACCWKHSHLMPQQSIRDGLQGAEKWLAGEVRHDELYELSYDVEGEAFFLDYCNKPEDIEKIEAWIGGIAELDGIPFEEARALLMRAAYFAEKAMLYSKGLENRDPKKLDSYFLCSDLLRAHLQPKFGRWYSFG